MYNPSVRWLVRHIPAICGYILLGWGAAALSPGVFHVETLWVFSIVIGCALINLSRQLDR